MRYRIAESAEVLGMEQVALSLLIRRLKAAYPSVPTTRFTESQLLAVAALRRGIEGNPWITLKYVESVFSILSDVCPWHLPSPYIGLLRDSNKAIFLTVNKNGLPDARQMLLCQHYIEVADICLETHLKCIGSMARWFGKTPEQISTEYAARSS